MIKTHDTSSRITFPNRDTGSAKLPTLAELFVDELKTRGIDPSTPEGKAALGKYAGTLAHAAAGGNGSLVSDSRNALLNVELNMLRLASDM